MKDVAAANLLAMDSRIEEPGAVINVGSGVGVSLNDLYRELAVGVGLDGAPSYGPERAGDVRHSLADSARAVRLIGFTAGVPWRDGLRNTLDWYRNGTPGGGD